MSEYVVITDANGKKVPVQIDVLKHELKKYGFIVVTSGDEK